MTTSSPHPRWFRPTPGRAVLALLAVEGILFASQHFHWFPFNQHKGYTVLIAVAAVLGFLTTMLLWWLGALVFRVRFQFSIMSMLLLMLAVAGVCAWLKTERNLAREQEAIANSAWFVEYDCDDTQGVDPPGPKWLRRALGRHFFDSITRLNIDNKQITDTDLEQIKNFSRLQWLWLSGTQVTDAGLKHVGSMSSLEQLDLGSTGITDSGLANLKGLTALEAIYLVNTRITDEGVKHLRGLPKLRLLNLEGTRLTDAGLQYLGEWPDLFRVTLLHTQVTDAGVEKFRRAHPECDILVLPSWQSANSTADRAPHDHAPPRRLQQPSSQSPVDQPIQRCKEGP
jgi:hypothetical protein